MMTISDHCKPLFNRHLLAEACRTFSPMLDEEQQRIVANWAASSSNGSLLGQKEKPLQGQFLSQIFDRLLGYRQIVGADGIHHMEPETSSKAVKGYRPPDARLGWYGDGIDLTRAVLELKAPGADLDVKQNAAYGRLTPVEQAFGYAAKVDGCRWVLVSNFLELRVYRTNRGQGYCHRFDLADLAEQEHLRTFLFLFARESLFGPAPDTESTVERLATHTYVEEERITKAFYIFYSDLRASLFDNLRRDNSPPSGQVAEVHDVHLLELTQKILDRCLFICFCEDTGLLPAKILTQALTAKSEGFVKVSRWQQLCGLFRAVDQGHSSMGINGYNGGLFVEDAALESLKVSDACLTGIETLARYDFETDLNVNILGHIFEQSINDLEALRAEIRGATMDKQRSRRKRDGIFYTPEMITRFMVSRAIGGWLEDRHAEIEARHRTGKPGPMSNETRLKVWIDYLEVLGQIKVLDIACGSGAFLVAAFDELLARYSQANRAIAELQGSPVQLGLFDLDRQILQENLFGVDLNPESVEITKLSLWLKTARRDKPLNNLDANIRCGNSLIEPPSDGANVRLRDAFASLPGDHRAFDWHGAFPKVFAQGGFDIVLGNPPYVRQEVFGSIKPYLAQRYASYHGLADLYVYFYERGLELLAPHGKLSFIVVNKWLRSGYGAPLRRLFAERAQFEEILDFGHAPIFEDADTFPCIIVAHGSTKMRARQPGTVQVCSIPRNRSTELSLDNYVHEHGYPIPWSRFSADSWSLESTEVDALMGTIRDRGVPLSEFVDVKPVYGIKTGLNDAFLISDRIRTELVRKDPACVDIIKPYLRGQDIKRWAPDWEGQWMIVLKSSQNFAWPWKDAGSNAEQVFSRTYPSLYAHMKSFEPRLRQRQDKGEYWWELRSCDYYDVFETPKIIHTDIAWQPQFAFSGGPLFFVNTCYVWPTDDLYALTVLNSPLIWAYMWRNAQHGKDDALRLFTSFTTTLPIADPNPQIRREIEEGASAAIELMQLSMKDARELITWLRLEFGIERPGRRIESFAELTSEQFAAAVAKRRIKGASRLTPKALSELQSVHQQYTAAENGRTGKRLAIERRLSDLVVRAYGLTENEIDLLWRTAPPRMPL